MFTARSLVLIFATLVSGAVSVAQSLPDLIVTSVSVSGPSGGNVQVTETVVNQGGGNADGSVTYFYLSSDGTTRGAQLPAQQYIFLSDMSSGPVTTTAPLPASAATGSYYVMACANALGGVVESNMANNCTASSTKIIVQLPDLIVTAVSVSDLGGGNVQVTDTVVNQGGGNADGGSLGYFYLSADGTTLGAQLPAQQYAPSLQAGISSGPMMTTAPLPANVAAGSYYVMACANALGAVVESNMANNCAASSTKISVGLPANSPVLQLRINDTPATVHLSDIVNLDWIVWGADGSTTAANRSATAFLIKDFTPVNAASPAVSTNGYILFNWENGIPAATGSGLAAEVQTSVLNAGFQISVPADTTAKTLNIYTGVHGGATLSASLSDGSSPSITDSSVTAGGESDKTYSIDFQAASSGQTLTVTLLLTSNGYMALQAATLQPHFPSVALVSPQVGQQTTAGAPVALAVNASQFDNSISNVAVAADGSAIFNWTAPTYSAIWSGATAGHHKLVAQATDTANLAGVSAPVEFDVIGTGGSLSVSSAASTSIVDLTSEGTADWISFSPTDYSYTVDNRKAGVLSLISNYAQIGNHTPWANPVIGAQTFSFEDGTPESSAASVAPLVYCDGVGNGYEVTVQSDGTPRTLRLYAAVEYGRARLQAFLNDGGAPAIVDESLDNVDSAVPSVYAINFTGSSLTIRLTLDKEYDWGDIEMFGATLSGAPMYPSLTSIAVSPAIASVPLGSSQQFTAVGAYSDGTTKDITSIVTWSSSNSLAASISAAGLASGTGAGQTTVQANLGSVVGTASLTVSSLVITATASPLPNAAGWNNTSVTVSFSCVGQSTAIVTCPAPQVVSSDGAGQVVVGTATDNVGNVASANMTLNIDRTPPAVAVAAPADGGTLTTANVAVSGTVADSLSGVSLVSCNGSTAPVISGGFSCNLTLQPGLNLIMVRATDQAGNVGVAKLYETLSAPMSAPESLAVTPSNANMVVGATASFTVVDNEGRVRSDASWTLDAADAQDAQMATDGSGLLTALLPGTVTLTASVQGISATATVTIYSGTALPIGTLSWTYKGNGSSVIRSIPAIPSASGVDVFVVESSGMIRAMTSSGSTVWSAGGYPPNEYSFVPDFKGGLVAFGTGLTRLDAMTGKPTATYTYSDPSLSTSYGTKATAMHPDGTIFVVDGGSIVGIDPDAGPKFRVPIPNSTINVSSSDLSHCAQQYSDGPSVPAAPVPLVVAGDGYAYLPFIQSSITGTQTSWGYPVWGGEMDYECLYSGHSQLSTQVLRISSTGDNIVIPIANGTRDVSTTGFNSPSYYTIITDARSGNVAETPGTIITESDGTVELWWASTNENYYSYYNRLDSSNTLVPAQYTAHVTVLTDGQTADQIVTRPFGTNGQGGNWGYPGSYEGWGAPISLWKAPVLQGGDGTVVSQGDVWGGLVAYSKAGDVKWQRTAKGYGQGSGSPEYVDENNNVITQLTDSLGNCSTTTIDSTGTQTTGLNVGGQVVNFPCSSLSWTGSQYRVSTNTGTLLAFNGASDGSAPLVYLSSSYMAMQTRGASGTNTDTKQPEYPPLPQGANDAIKLAMNRLLQLLAKPSCAGRADSVLFNSFEDWNGFPVTTKSFIQYLANAPEFYNGPISTLPSKVAKCGQVRWYQRWGCNGDGNTVGWDWTNDTTAMTVTPSYPFKSFWQPVYKAANPPFTEPGSCTANCATWPGVGIDPANGGANLTNESGLLHEALHGMTGLYDDQIETYLKIVVQAGDSYNISVYIRDNVLNTNYCVAP